MLEDGQQHIFRKPPPHTQRKKTIKETLVEGICGNFYRRLILYWFWKSIHEQLKTNQSNHHNRLITAMAMDSSTKFVDVWIKFCLYFTVYIYFWEKMCVFVTAELQNYVGSPISACTDFNHLKCFHHRRYYIPSTVSPSFIDSFFLSLTVMGLPSPSAPSATSPAAPPSVSAGVRSSSAPDAIPFPIFVNVSSDSPSPENKTMKND